MALQAEGCQKMNATTLSASILSLKKETKKTPLTQKEKDVYPLISS